MEMSFENTGEVCLFVRSMGKLLRITAAFTSIDEANEHCKKHTNDAVVAEIGKTVLIADKYDSGRRLKA